MAQKFRRGGNDGMTFDVRGASNSVVHNMAGDFGKFEKGDKTRFYGIFSDRTYEIQSRIRASFARAFLREAKIKDDLFADSGIVVMASDTSIKTPES
ncbi:MAG: hypothetical protein MI975_19245 [Cytophagales bacterium]|nr:hypothetical protein [Cytophagales bacterium]